MKYGSNKAINRVIYHTLVCVFGVVMIYPLLWMVMSSFKDSSEIFKNAQSLWPSTFKLSNYASGWTGFGGISFAIFFKNSFYICILATIGTIASSSVIAFGFARCNFKLKKLWFSCMLVSMMMPFQIIMIPQFIIFKKLNWIGTFAPLIAPYFFGLPFGIFLIMQFVRGIPKELDEAAKIDGCSIYGIFGRVILPLIVPSLVTTAIFSFMWRWDDFLASLLYLNKPSKYPVSLALKMFSDPSAQSDWGAMFAMASLSLIPIFIIFVSLQKYLVEGISTSGLKD
jgi:multiple sugar transport system permease protein